MYLFPDTHFFLHYKHAQDIAWSEVTPEAEIRLVVGRAVMKELDKKKFEMRGRPQDRAKSYVSKLGLVATTEAPAVLRSGEPRIVLEMAPERPSGWTPPADLDPTWGDDVLLADILAFQDRDHAAEVMLLTGDPGLMAKARGHGVRVMSLLDRDWALPEEKTSEERELAKLRRENEALKQTGPSITCDLTDGDRSIDSINLEVTRYSPLGEDAVTEMLSEMKTRHPKVVVSPHPASGASHPPGTRVLDMDDADGSVEWLEPTDEEVAGYDRAYDAWVEEAASFIRSFSSNLPASRIEATLGLVLQNEGNDPAEGVQFRIEARGGFLVFDADKVRDEKKAAVVEPLVSPKVFRSPPPPPRLKRKAVYRASSQPSSLTAMLEAATRNDRGWAAMTASASRNDPGLLAMTASASAYNHSAASLLASALSPSSRGVGFDMSEVDPSAFQSASAIPIPTFTNDYHLMPPQRPEPRKPHLFYSDDAKGSEHGTGLGFECAEFRHRLEPKNFRLQLCWQDSMTLPRNGAVWVRLSARNMRQPYEKTYPVRVKIIEADVRGMVAALLP